jgi:predicted Zn-dependent protease
MRKRPVILLITGALLAVLPAHAGWEEGVAAFKAGNFAQAVKEFEALAAASPEQAQVQVMLGRSLLKTNRAPQAVTALRKAYDLNPNDVATQIFLGQAYLDAGRAGEAVQLLGRVNASSLPAAQQQAFSAIYSEALTKSGQGERAADELRKVAAAKPNDPDIQYQYGAMAFNAGDISAAIGAFEKAYRLKSSETKYAKALINALVRAGRESNDNSTYTRAIEPARALVSANGSYENLLLLGEVQLGAKQYGTAAATFGQAASRSPSEWLPHFYAGQAHTAAGSYAEAEAALKRGLGVATQANDKARIHRQLGFVYEKLKNPAQAIVAYRSAGDTASVTRIEENQKIAEHNAQAEAEARALAELKAAQDKIRQQLQEQGAPPPRN